MTSSVILKNTVPAAHHHPTHQGLVSCSDKNHSTILIFVSRIAAEFAETGGFNTLRQPDL